LNDPLDEAAIRWRESQIVKKKPADIVEIRLA
jgi:hypothetical protein